MGDVSRSDLVTRKALTGDRQAVVQVVSDLALYRKLLLHLYRMPHLFAFSGTASRLRDVAHQIERGDNPYFDLTEPDWANGGISIMREDGESHE